MFLHSISERHTASHTYILFDTTQYDYQFLKLRLLLAAEVDLAEAEHILSLPQAVKVAPVDIKPNDMGTTVYDFNLWFPQEACHLLRLWKRFERCVRPCICQISDAIPDQ